MADEQNNPNDAPDEDWAMSEPELPVEEKIEARKQDENVARLYDPLDTGELDDWDLPAPDDTSAESFHNDPESQSPPSEPENGPSVFIPPPNSFEVLKPELRSPSGEGWAVSPPNADGWVMPEPIFRSSEGRELATGIGKNAAHQPQSAAVENLPDLYLPPDLDDSLAPDSNDPVGEFGEDVVSSEVNSAEPVEQINFDSPSETPEAVTPITAAKAGGKRKLWLYFLFGILLFVGISLLVIIGVFGLFFYTSQR